MNRIAHRFELHVFQLKQRAKKNENKCIRIYLLVALHFVRIVCAPCARPSKTKAMMMNNNNNNDDDDDDDDDADNQQERNCVH